MIKTAIVSFGVFAFAIGAVNTIVAQNISSAPRPYLETVHQTQSRAFFRGTFTQGCEMLMSLDPLYGLYDQQNNKLASVVLCHAIRVKAKQEGSGNFCVDKFEVIAKMVQGLPLQSNLSAETRNQVYFGCQSIIEGKNDGLPD
jgi:hypothetical protein